MPVSQNWYNTVGSGSGAQLTLAYDTIQVDGDKARLIGPRVDWWQKPGWTDSTNWMDAGGSALAGGRIFTNRRINGPQTWWLDPVWVPIRYGAGTTVTFAVTLYGVSHFTGDGTARTFSWDIELPARPYESPDPATGVTATRVSDSRIDLSWVPHYTNAAGPKPWASQVIDRTDRGDWGSFVNASGWLGWEPTSWSDLSVQPNSRYDYRHIAFNSAGSSPHAYAAASVYTTPASPTVSARKTASGDVEITSTQRAPWATGMEVQDSPAGGAWVTLTSTASPWAAWTHTTPDPTKTHRYRARVRTPDGLWSDWSPVSETIQLLAKPNPPTGLTPSVAARGEEILLAWTPQPVDGTPQQAYEVRHRLTGTSTWTTTGYVTSALSTWTLPAGTYTASFEWQVRTKHQHASWSDWSNAQATSVTARPTGSIITPTVGATISSGTLAITATYFQADGLPMQAWRASLVRDGVTLQTRTGTAVADLALVAFAPSMLNDSSVSVVLEVQSSAGLWATPVTRTWTVRFIPPLPPEVSIVWDRDRASCTIQIVGTDGALGPAGTPTASTHEVWADGALIGTVARSGSFTYMVPSLNPGAQIEVRAISDLPSTSVSMWPLPIPLFPGLHLNAGAGMLIHAAMWEGSPQLGVDQVESVTADVWQGDTAPSPTWGADDYQVIKLSGHLDFDGRLDVSRDAWRQVVRAHSTVCYRDGIRKLYGFLSGLSFNESYLGHASVSVTFTESESDPGDLLALLP